MIETKVRGLSPIGQARETFAEHRRAMIHAWRSWLEMEPPGKDTRSEIEHTLNLIERVREQVVNPR